MSVSNLVLRRAAGALAACAAIFSPLAHAQMTAPVVTAWADIKQLKFDWDPVPNAAYYELLFHAPGSTVTFFTLGPTKTAATSNISAHLFDWDQWSYGVNACNGRGSCSEGWPPGTTKSLMQDAIGYFKSSVTASRSYFGHRVAIAEDGNTFAVMSREEAVGSSRAAPFYIFTKIAGQWRQQARFFPSTTVPRLHNVGLDSFRVGSLALSQDGNTLLVGMPFRIAVGYFGYNNSISIYRRVNNTWSLEHQVVSPDQVDTSPSENQYFARMNTAGTRIVYKLNDSGVHMIERGSSGWVERGVGQQPAGATCADTRLSGNGNTLAYYCDGPSASYFGRVFLARNPDWLPVRAFDAAAPQVHFAHVLALNYDASRIAVSSREVQDPPVNEDHQVRVYRMVSGAWQQFGNTLRPGSWTGESFNYGEQMEFSKSGGYLAVGDESDRAQGTGVWSPPLVAAPGQAYSGAVYVYEFPTSGPRLRRVIKPNVEGLAALSDLDLSFANDGKTLLLGQPQEDSKATGIDGNRHDTSTAAAGAAWLY